MKSRNYVFLPCKHTRRDGRKHLFLSECQPISSLRIEARSFPRQSMPLFLHVSADHLVPQAVQLTACWQLWQQKYDERPKSSGKMGRLIKNDTKWT